MTDPPTTGTPILPPTADADVRVMFDDGLALYRAGQPAGAERICRQILRLQPSHFNALHLLGVIAAQNGRRDDAVVLLGQAIRQNETVAAAHHHLGNALRDLGRLEAAIASYDRAIALQPEVAAAHMARGIALRDLRRFEDALESVDRVIALCPSDAPAHSARAAVLIGLQRHEEAIASCERAIALAPRLIAPYSNRAAALNSLKRHSEALADCDQAIRLDPEYLMAHVNRAAVLYELQRPEEALESCDRVMELAPTFAEGYANRAMVLKDLQRASEALASSDKAIELQPDCALAHANRGCALHDLMRLDEALAAYDQAMRLRPEESRSFVNAALVHLQAGRFAQGWELFEHRDKPGPLKGTRWSQPLWSGGESLAGKTLFVYWEQGLGDTVQYCRYAKLVKDLGGRVVLTVQEPLRALMRGLDRDIEILAGDRRPADFDLHCPMLGLPRAFKTSLDTIPAAVPYLHAEPERAAFWRQRIGVEGCKIGICWQGNPNLKVDVGRSFALRYFQRLSQIPGVRLISLQKGSGAGQLANLPADMKVERLGDGFDAGPDAFLDCAAVMGALDLVITSDTAIAHLAGALARPTWVLLKRVPEWRWLLDRNDSPWYPTMRLFRQRRAGEWEGVFEDVYDELEHRLTHSGNNVQ